MTIISLVMRAGWRDLARSKWILAYAAGFFVLAQGLFWFGGTGPQVVVSLLNVVLLVVPLVSLVFGTVHLYGSREFVELLLAQPIARRPLFTGLYLGLVVPLAGAFVVGAGVPFALHAGAGASSAALAALLAAGVLLSLVFGGLAAVIAGLTDDRLRGVGIALGVWLLLTIVYDGGVLAATAAFADYPLERPLLAAMVGNPVDLSRLVVLSQLDAAALMGYTGAVFTRTLGTTGGILAAIAALLAWSAAPFVHSARTFARRDF